MARLFVALELPDPIRQALTQLQPPPVKGLRLVREAQLHLTLHFIGEGEIPLMTSALSRIKAPELALEIESVGRFPATGRASTLWVGVKSNSQLSELWKETGRALESTNQFVIEKRQFTPHITIARCDRQVPEKTIDAFLDRGRQFTTPMFKVPRFVLYSSDLQAEGPVYHPESCFDLNS